MNRAAERGKPNLSPSGVKSVWMIWLVFLLTSSACQSRGGERPQFTSQQLLEQAEEAVQGKDLRQARELFQRAMESSPGDPRLPYRAGQILAEKQYYTDAIEHFEKALTRALDKPAKAEGAGDALLIEIYWQLAQSHFAIGNFSRALECLDKFKPSKGDVKGEAAYYNLRGSSRVMSGDIIHGQNDLERAIQLDDSQGSYYRDLILAASRIKDMARATELAKQAQAKFPRDAKLQILTVQVLDRKTSTLPAWKITGEGVVCCPCATPCPCRSNGAPTHKRCESLGVMRITSGHCGKTQLAGTRFAVPGCMNDPLRFVPTLYIDEHTSPDAEEGIKQIFKSFTPGHPMIFPRIRRVPIKFQKNGPILEFESSGLLRVKVRMHLDAEGNPLMRTAALDYFSNVLAYADNLIYWFRDANLGSEATWDFSGRQSNYRRIDVSSDDYKQGKMLIQWGDKSGSFNAKHLELIHGQKLPLLPAPAQK